MIKDIKIRVAAIVSHEDKILFNRQEIPGKACVYSLMGGHLEFGESVKNCLVREFKEELEWDIEVQNLLYVCENSWLEEDPEDFNFNQKMHGVELYFYAKLKKKLIGKDPKTEEEHLWPGWFSKKDIEKDGKIVPSFLEERLFEDMEKGFSSKVKFFTAGF